VVSKKIMVGNASYDVHPDDRDNHFEQNWRKRAIKRDIVAFCSVDLYAAFCAVRQGRCSPEAFWRNVFNCKGVAGVDELTRLDQESGA
jgi:hypothetical protein